MKYNKGDKAIRIKPDYFTNKFHFEQSIVIHEIENANEKYFAFQGVNIDEPIAGMNRGIVYEQSTGRPLDYDCGKRVWLHLEKDYEQIKQLINEGLESAKTAVFIEKADRLHNLNLKSEEIKASIKEVENDKADLQDRVGFEKFNAYLNELEVI